jgi:hypothetical protein
MACVMGIGMIPKQHRLLDRPDNDFSFVRHYFLRSSVFTLNMRVRVDSLGDKGSGESFGTHLCDDGLTLRLIRAIKRPTSQAERKASKSQPNSSESNQQRSQLGISHHHVRIGSLSGFVVDPSGFIVHGWPPDARAGFGR